MSNRQPRWECACGSLHRHYVSFCTKCGGKNPSTFASDSPLSPIQSSLSNPNPPGSAPPPFPGVRSDATRADQRALVAVASPLENFKRTFTPIKYKETGLWTLNYMGQPVKLYECDGRCRCPRSDCYETRHHEHHSFGGKDKVEIHGDSGNCLGVFPFYPQLFTHQSESSARLNGWCVFDTRQEALTYSKDVGLLRE